MRLVAQPNTDAPLAIAWEECACLLCGGAYLTPLLEAADPLQGDAGLRFLIVRCNRCGFCYTNPRPDPVSIRPFYPADYHCHRIKESSSSYDPLQQWLPTRAGRLLDFGAGSGNFLMRLKALGWTVTGLDASEAAGARMRDRGLDAHVGTLPHPLWADPCFEAITMRQSLEHAHQPLDVLHAAYRLLTTGGRLLVAVPNFDSFAARWFGPHWYGLDLPRHLTHFTPATLRMMLQRAGFEHIELHRQTRGSWIRRSAELAEQRQRGGGMTRFLKSRLGSGLAGWWGSLNGRSEVILAVAVRA